MEQGSWLAILGHTVTHLVVYRMNDLRVKIFEFYRRRERFWYGHSKEAIRAAP
jgi:hypothetical protein